VLFSSADAAATHVFGEARSIALASFYAGLSRVPDHRILDCLSFTVPMFWRNLLRLFLAEDVASMFSKMVVSMYKSRQCYNPEDQHQ
jgi:hypothetical protein